ncbi:NAD-dependent epimerase/dehydratase family protein [Streptomyces halstedii]|uniref:NAD-dependent epimerase/dehydratase family protein n=1 Tax=Streptomyces halstedii TaxID=1944 RepID=A0A6N9UDF0_STRHA|nr:NAD-dependent epimerase/dehydratase family protein [Streptomyces halstedii]NEA20669.1 NAD-dependent epimerase/dehydratase family protein [Streptomyces halstedii]
MKICVLGGSWFLGKAVAQEALDRGWSVSAFNRGRSGAPPTGTRTIRGDRTVQEDLRQLAQEAPWDAVIDTSASELAPRDVLAGAKMLEPVAKTYVYISTVNAYRGWPSEPLSESSEVLDGPADADINYGRLPANWAGPDWYYGRQKAGAERAVLQTFGASRVSILRPGVILGPGEYVGRLPWWLRRTSKGGEILAPGSPNRSIQPVDVRDVASFALDQAAYSGGGVFNVTAPVGRETMGGFLSACLDATGRAGQLNWASDKLLIESGVEQWTELPLWRTHAGVWSIDSSRAQAAGLLCRPLAETVTDTWEWLQGGGVPVEHPRWAEHGISVEKERKILARLNS